MNRRDFVAGALGGAAGLAAGIQGTLRWDASRHPPSRFIPEFSRLSFSQQGEDIVIYHALHDLLALERPTYMDVGAAHPVRSNNTYLLWGTGSRGVLVEPNPLFVEMLKQQRPGDVVVAAGIGVTDAAEADYYEIEGNPLLNTFSPKQVEKLQRGSSTDVVARVSKMPLININRAIREYLGAPPDLLSTDIEGLDAAIIKSLDLEQLRPGVICCEGTAFDRGGYESELARYLVDRDYLLRGGSVINSIFVDRRRVAA